MGEESATWKKMLARRATGFTRAQMVGAAFGARPIVGFARTATLRAASPSAVSHTTA